MPRSLRDQVIVITGASSGIGRETAIEFGLHGSSIVLAARNPDALNEVAKEIQRLGGTPFVVVTDVAEWDQVNRLAQQAVERFGRIDTWINNAAVMEHATVEQTTLEEAERIIRVNLLGQIAGTKAVLPQFIKQGYGTIINVTSVLGVRSVPLLSIYCATKHGIKGFTESLRMELQRDHPGINVTLVLPASINTPLFAHSRSKLGVMPQPIPPVYEPGAVARAILHAAEHPQRDIFVGSIGPITNVLEALVPSLIDWYMVSSGRFFRKQMSGQPDDGKDNLFHPEAGTGATTGRFGRESMSMSVYTRYLGLHPVRGKILSGVAALGLLAIARRAGR
ncbi:SDR family oxidoreductase [Nitrolancea hollandica]|uniref:Short-chain dehydrogenase/reductase SDR n=1 Tax=Nitrolancea hollandica Lb TaxID=1129897 RepID=I4EE60_9BACT|nr:SDR family oxidoreductase [Nitrolancea hollandica]CCF82972.1 Short-chain dehydrogenase/reductase SDR [Nitrolancea hollandica Lb]